MTWIIKQHSNTACSQLTPQAEGRENVCAHFYRGMIGFHGDR